MKQGATVFVTPSWVAMRIPLDFSWDTLTLPHSSRGPWWGEMTALGRIGITEGEWEMTASDLFLWVPGSPLPGYSFLVAVMWKARIPLVRGERGVGELATSLVPARPAPQFDWVVG